MLSLSTRTSPKRPRRAAPQVDALEDIISLTSCVPGTPACPPPTCRPCPPPPCPAPKCPTISVDVDIEQKVDNDINACYSNVNVTNVQVAVANDTHITIDSEAGTVYYI